MIIENENGYKQYVMTHWTIVDILISIYENDEEGMIQYENNI